MKCSLLMGDVVSVENAIHRLEQLGASKVSIIEELNNLNTLKKNLSDSEKAYSQKKYNEVMVGL